MTEKATIQALLASLLSGAIISSASDIHIKTGSPVLLRINGVLQKTDKKLNKETVNNLIRATTSPAQYERYIQEKELDYAISYNHSTPNKPPQTTRFRVNAFTSRQNPGLILRRIESQPPQLTNLGVPDAVPHLANSNTGLILVVGATGSGKSTTIAGIIDHINTTKPVSIITLENPIEYIHTDKQASIIQREIEIDTPTFATGLKSMLRQDPDVILLGELRDAETTRIALEASNTGHLVLATLHANSAAEAVGRIVDLFRDPQEKHQIRLSLADSLRGIIAQRLIPSTTGGRCAAVEVMVNTSRISSVIMNPNKGDITEIMKEAGKSQQMVLMDDALMKLFHAGKISEENTIRYATSEHDVKKQLRVFV